MIYFMSFNTFLVLLVSQEAFFFVMGMGIYGYAWSIKHGYDIWKYQEKYDRD